MEEKSHLRTKFKELRKGLDIAGVSEAICKNIRLFEPYRSAQNVMIFYPTANEINLLPLLEDGKNFYFPRVEGDRLNVCPYTEGVEFKKSSFNILEPCSNPVDADILDLVFVPALAADVKGYRLGYGGGFYDRFLPLCKNAVFVIPVYEGFVVEDLPAESFDVCANYIITNGKRLTVM